VPVMSGSAFAAGPGETTRAPSSVLPVAEFCDGGRSVSGLSPIRRLRTNPIRNIRGEREAPSARMVWPRAGGPIRGLSGT
jgi:hypothetical protein